MSRSLHVLIVEDSEDDARLLTRELTRSEYRVTAERVETADEFTRVLATGQWELVLSDYSLPHFSGAAALRLLKESGRDIPFIFVSGTIGEDIAVGAMKSGAHDYVMKGNLTRLIPAIERELRDAVERSQHRSAEMQMRMSEHKYRHLFRSMSDAALLVSEETNKIIDANEQAEVLFGRPREDILGLPCAEIYTAPALVSPTDNAWHVPGRCETVVKRQNGATIPVHVSVTRVVLHNRPFVLTLFHDLSERKQAESALRNVLRHARTMFMRFSIEAPPGWREQGVEWAAARFRWEARALDEQIAQEVLPLALPPGKTYEFGWIRAKHPDDAIPMGLVAHTALLSGAPTWQQTFRCTDRFGRLHWFAQVASVEVTGEGRWQVTTINTDITDRVLAEEALRMSEERLSTIFHLSPTAICIVRASDDQFVDANEAFISGSGYSRDEIIGHTPAELQLWNHIEERAAIVRDVREKGTAIAFKLRGRRKSGAVGVGLCSITRITLNGEQHLLWLIQDITELDRAEEARRESDHRFRQVAENIDEVFWLTDVNKSQMIYVSPAYRRIWGRTCESIYAAPLSWLDAVRPEDSERVRAALEVQAQGNYDIEYRIVRPDRSVRWIHERAFPVKDADGHTYRIAGVASDITIRRELEEQFRQAQKMEAVGLLAGGIAHDFNNLLTIIQMQSSFLIELVRETPEVETGVQQIMDAAKRAGNLTRQLLTFSRRQTQAARTVDLGEILTEMIKMLRRILGEHISLESHFSTGVPKIHADPGMMEQVLMNLVINARDAMPTGGQLTISLEAVNLDHNDLAAHPDGKAGRFACLTVKDTGCGIAPEIRTRIFEPFFTTKEIGKGTGLGLATVFGIVQEHHGWIELESTVGQGSAFHVFLPALAESATQVDRAKKPPAAGGGNETILLVEDDGKIRAVVGAALRQRGYQVIEACSGGEALVRWDEAKGKVDLLLTDVLMPGGVSGKELAEQLLQRSPRLHIIYASGHGTSAVARELQLTTSTNYLEKPYSFTELATIVRQKLDEQSGRS